MVTPCLSMAVAAPWNRKWVCNALEQPTTDRETVIMDRIAGSDKDRHLMIGAQTTHRVMPHRYPFQLVDCIQYLNLETGLCRGIKQITMTDPVLSGHFPGYPIYPGVLLIEASVQNAGFIPILQDVYEREGSYEAVLERISSANPYEKSPESKLLVLAESRIKHMRPIFPGQTVVLEAQLMLRRDGMCNFKIGVWVDGYECTRGQATLSEVAADMSTIASGGC